jgi:hypothetical protein
LLFYGFLGKDGMRKYLEIKKDIAGSYVRTQPCLLGPEGKLGRQVQQVTNGPKNVYSHKRKKNVEGKIS